MGRNCGDIAVHTALACGAEYVMVPEAPWSIEEIAERIKWGVLNGKRSTILVMAEGAFASLTSDVNAICAQHEELKDIATDTMTGFKLASKMCIRDRFISFCKSSLLNTLLTLRCGPD